MELPHITLIVGTLLVATLVGVLIYFMLYIPRYQRVTEQKEGFFGGVARGSGYPDCLRTLPEGSQILDILTKKTEINSSPDYKELQLILSKLACLKKDLMSPSGVVEATRYQAFETAHDRINVAEVCALCISKNVAARDLDIIFATWRDRGDILLRKLSTAAQLNTEELSHVEALFNAAWNDVYDIAKSVCLKTDFSKQNGGSTAGGDVGGYEPENLTNMRDYTYKYGHLSASGGNGAV